MLQFNIPYRVTKQNRINDNPLLHIHKKNGICFSYHFYSSFSLAFHNEACREVCMFFEVKEGKILRPKSFFHRHWNELGNLFEWWVYMNFLLFQNSLWFGQFVHGIEGLCWSCKRIFKYDWVSLLLIGVNTYYALVPMMIMPLLTLWYLDIL